MKRFAAGIGRWRRPAGALGALVRLTDAAARQLFEADGLARVVTDREGNLLRASPALAALLGPGAPARPTLADLLAAEAALPLQAALRAPAGPIPAHGRHDDGRDVPLRVALVPVREADGQVSGHVATLHDAAPQGEATAATAVAGEIRARRLEAIGSLASGVAHDFNNLLQTVAGAAELLGERPGLSEAAREEVALILAGSRRGADLVRQLLAFSRQQTLQPRIVAVNRAITDLAPLLRRSLGERVRLDLALEEPGRTVRVDPGQLDQALVNLAVNARDAMPAGGTLALRTRRLNLLAARSASTDTIPPGRYVAIEVEDNGTGIPPEVLPRIFDPFFTTRTGTGTGLGLSTVVGIVRQSGGFLEVESTPGQGTLFRILLPRSREPAPADPPPAPPPAALPAGRGVVMLVEDEEGVRRLAERALQRRGWEVLAAESAEAALDMLTPGLRLACLVTDMVMPGMDGAALAVELRSRLGDPALPAIIASGYAEVPRHDAIGAAATVFLPKPYALRELVERVSDLASGQPVVARG